MPYRPAIGDPFVLQVKLPKVQIDIQGLPNRLRRWNYGTAIALGNRMSKYAPPVPNSRYRRTGLYGKSWKAGGFSPLITPSSVTVFNPASHAPYVGGRKRSKGGGGIPQALIHAAHGWQSVSDVAPQVIKDRQMALQQALVVLKRA